MAQLFQGLRALSKSREEDHRNKPCPLRVGSITLRNPEWQSGPGPERSVGELSSSIAGTSSFLIHFSFRMPL